MFRSYNFVWKRTKEKLSKKASKHINEWKKGSPKDFREIVNQKFVDDFDEERKQTLIREVQEKLNKIMKEKDCWLKTSGIINEKITFCWMDKIDSPKIIDVEINWEKGADIYFNFKAEEMNDFKCILRFGKGTGFSNIRLDIR